MQPAVTLNEAKLDAIAWGFLGSIYASRCFTEWTIDRRLDAYLRREELRSVADDGTVSAALLDRVMANICSAVDNGTLGRETDVDHTRGAAR
ncbi:hypothetical protein [Mycobacterium sp.]|uniref:hypothetical protein n=1 Tax=Mycobacterium sp. TaxID=1785 RepID=UPI003BB1816A